MRGRLFAIAFILVFFGFSVGAVQQAYFDAGIEGGESFTTTTTFEVHAGEYNTTNQAGLDDVVFADQEDVTVEVSNKEYASQGNWTWFQSNGTIFWEPGSDISNGSNAMVTYTWGITTDEQQLMKEFGTYPVRVLGNDYIIIAGVILVMMALAYLVGRT